MRGPRAVPILMALLLAGCAGPRSVDEAGTSGAPPVALSVANHTVPQMLAALPPPATFETHGLAFSDCAYSENVFFFKHEWAAGLLPDGYRPDNYQGGNVGTVFMTLFRCAALSIGNETFVADRHVALFAVAVNPPDAVDAPGPDAYVLDVLVDDETLAQDLAGSSIPTRLATFDWTSNIRVTAGDSFAAEVMPVGPRPESSNYTNVLRYHWKAGGPCFVDSSFAVEADIEAEAIFEATAGSPAQLAGPAGRLVGLGADGQANGLLAAPVCP